MSRYSHLRAFTMDRNLTHAVHLMTQAIWKPVDKAPRCATRAIPVPFTVICPSEVPITCVACLALTEDSPTETSSITSTTP
jgi:hypothetical protein